MDNGISTHANSVTYSLTVDDYVRGGQLSFVRHYTRSPKAWLRLAFACAVVVGIMYVNRGTTGFNPFLAVAFVAIIAGTRLLLPYYLTVPASFRKNYAQNKRFQQPLSLAWDERELTFSSENSMAKIAWNEMFDFYENDHVMLFYTAPNLMQIIPKHSLSDVENVQVGSLGAAIPRRG